VRFDPSNNAFAGFGSVNRGLESALPSKGLPDVLIAGSILGGY
jgi:hypothetical protein